MTAAVVRLGDFVAGLTVDDIPRDVLEKARSALLHNLSVAAAAGELSQAARRWSTSRGGGGGARALGSGLQLAPADAAFVNGCLMHARAQDDVFFPGLTHVGAATIPAALALAETRGASLGQVLVAMVAGYEAAAAVSVLAGPVTTAHGFRASGIYGVFGSAAAAAHLLGLDSPVSAHALAIASSFAAGTNQTWVDGSMEWQFQVGAAARSGLEAATLAQHGGTGSAGCFEGTSGFFASFARDASIAGTLGQGLGEVWHTREVTFKPYPVCAILQSPVEAAVALHDRLGYSDFSRASLRLAPAEAHYPGTAGAAPFDDPGAALMSASYCLAVALSEGTVRAQDLFRSHEPRLVEAARTIETVADESISSRHFALEVEFGDGRVERVVGDGSSAFNWCPEEVATHVARLKPEVPPGIDLDRLAGQVLGSLDTPAADLVDLLVASSPSGR